MKTPDIVVDMNRGDAGDSNQSCWGFVLPRSLPGESLWAGPRFIWGGAERGDVTAPTQSYGFIPFIHTSSKPCGGGQNHMRVWISESDWEWNTSVSPQTGRLRDTVDQNMELSSWAELRTNSWFSATLSRIQEQLAEQLFLAASALTSLTQTRSCCDSGHKLTLAEDSRHS